MDQALERQLRELLDKQAIAEVVQKWGRARDKGLWEELATTFHPGGIMNVMWFQGTHEDFIAACARRFKPGTSVTRHFFGVSTVRVAGDRAVADSPAFISMEGVVDDTRFVGMSFIRFIDHFERRAGERRAGEWRIVRRDGLYEGDRMSTERPIVFDPKVFDGLPVPYRYLAYRQAKNGRDVNPATPVDGGPLEADLWAGAERWLAGARAG